MIYLLPQKLDAICCCSVTQVIQFYGYGVLIIGWLISYCQFRCLVFFPSPILSIPAYNLFSWKYLQSDPMNLKHCQGFKSLDFTISEVWKSRFIPDSSCDYPPVALFNQYREPPQRVFFYLYYQPCVCFTSNLNSDSNIEVPLLENRGKKMVYMSAALSC